MKDGGKEGRREREAEKESYTLRMLWEERDRRTAQQVPRGHATEDQRG